MSEVHFATGSSPAVPSTRDERFRPRLSAARNFVAGWGRPLALSMSWSSRSKRQVPRGIQANQAVSEAITAHDSCVHR